MAAVAWDAGIEVVAPLEEQGFAWDLLQKKGEGFCILVFGVQNLKQAVERAERNGARVLFQADGLTGDEPWFDRFEVLDEVVLEDMFGVTTCLGQIEPRY